MIISLKTDQKTDIKFCLDCPKDNIVMESGFMVSGWIIDFIGITENFSSSMNALSKI